MWPSQEELSSHAGRDRNQCQSSVLAQHKAWTQMWLQQGRGFCCDPVFRIREERLSCNETEKAALERSNLDFKLEFRFDIKRRT